MKRTTNLPDDPPPLVERERNSNNFGSAAGGFPGVAAKLSLCAGLFSFLLGNHAATAKVPLSPPAVQGVWLVCVMLIVAGLGLSTWALVLNRRQKRPGVTGFAVAGLLINCVLIGLHAYTIVSAGRGRP